MTVIIDRFENGAAVCECENGAALRLPLSRLPSGVREGSVLRFADGRWISCPEEESIRREMVRKKLATLLCSR